LPEDRAAPVAVLPSPPAGLMVSTMVGGVESECVRRVSPDKRLEAQADKLLELCEIIGWTRELHAASIALKHLKRVLELAKVPPKREGSRRRKRGCRWVRASMSLPSHRCRIEGACKACQCGEERRHGPGVQVCLVVLVELVDTGLSEVLLVSATSVLMSSHSPPCEEGPGRTSGDVGAADSATRAAFARCISSSPLRRHRRPRSKARLGRPSYQATGKSGRPSHWQPRLVPTPSKARCMIISQRSKLKA
jgi:hypothetical protein